MYIRSYHLFPLSLNIIAKLYVLIDRFARLKFIRIILYLLVELKSDFNFTEELYSDGVIPIYRLKTFEKCCNDV